MFTGPPDQCLDCFTTSNFFSSKFNFLLDDFKSFFFFFSFLSICTLRNSINVVCVRVCVGRFCVLLPDLCSLCKYIDHTTCTEKHRLFEHAGIYRTETSFFFFLEREKEREKIDGYWFECTKILVVVKLFL